MPANDPTFGPAGVRRALATIDPDVLLAELGRLRLAARIEKNLRAQKYL